MNSQLNVPQGREQPVRLELLLASRLFLWNRKREKKNKRNWQNRNLPAEVISTHYSPIVAAAVLVLAKY